MTTPAQPATGAGAPGTGAPSTQPPADPAAAPPATDPPADDWGSTFEGLTPAEVKAKLDHARTWEKRAKDNKTALDNLKAQQQNPAPKDGEPTVESLQQQLVAANEAREAAETAALESAYNSTVSRVAAQVGCDAEALLDSTKFRDDVAERLGDDFDDDELREAITEVAKEYAKKPRFGTQPAGPSRSGADINGGPGGLRQLTEDDVSRMTPEQIVEAQDKGLLNNLLGRQ